MFKKNLGFVAVVVAVVAFASTAMAATNNPSISGEQPGSITRAEFDTMQSAMADRLNKVEAGQGDLQKSLVEFRTEQQAFQQQILQLLKQPATTTQPAAQPTTPVVSATSNDLDAVNPLSGPAPVDYDRATADGYQAYAPNQGRNAEGEVKFDVQGTTVMVTPPSRGLTVTEQELQADKFQRYVIGKDGKVVLGTVLLPKAGEAYEFHNLYSVEDLITLSKLSGMDIVMLGVNNFEEAILGKAQDGPVKTTKVLLVESINNKYEISGNLVLTNTAARKVISEQHVSDFNGICYWIQVRCPFKVKVGGSVIHHKSAQKRGSNYVIPEGELFTLFLGGRESVLGKDNGSEKCLPVHPARQYMPNK